ncbi:unnamed protein product [Closterium sp. NIES-53]
MQLLYLYSSSSSSSSPSSSSSSRTSLYPSGREASGMFPARTVTPSAPLCQLRTMFQLCATYTRSRHFSDPNLLRLAVWIDSHTAQFLSHADADTG